MGNPHEGKGSSLAKMVSPYDLEASATRPAAGGEEQQVHMVLFLDS